MNPSLHNLPLIQCLASGGTVITATNRLAHELRQQYDQQQVADDKLAWQNADVLPYNAWLQRLWQPLSDTLQPCPILLNDLQLVTVWENIIRSDIHKQTRHGQDSEALWNPHATAKSAVNAWQIMHDWQISLEQCAYSTQEDHRCMLRWAREFQKLCKARNWVDRHSMVNRLCEFLGGNAAVAQLFADSPSQLEFTGFDHILPQQQSLLDALQTAGIAVQVTPPQSPINQKVVAVDFANAAQQWLGAAHWAREKLTDQPNAKIAIIAPNLQDAAPSIEHALQQMLSPQQLVSPRTSSELPYHISLGNKLIQYPLVNAALLALKPLADEPLTNASIRQLVLSPFIYGADSEAIGRAKLERWCAQKLPHQIRFSGFLKKLAKHNSELKRKKLKSNEENCTENGKEEGCPMLQKALHAATASSANAPKTAPMNYWVRNFSTWLERIGWPGERKLNSDEYQTQKAFHEQLQQLATLELCTEPHTVATALAWLERRLTDQPFQVESHDAAVQVLGVLESAGQQFDGVWFGGLVDNDWPPPGRPSPFIAVDLQRKAGVFAASTSGNHEYATKLQQRLIACGNEAVLSRPHADDDIPMLPSSLLTALEIPCKPYPTTRFATPANIIYEHRPELVKFTDSCGSEFKPREEKAGGTAVLENQAKCPFRAFAKHRLGAVDVEQNQQGLSAPQRGSLIHKALELFWTAIRSAEKLHALSDEELEASIVQAVKEASSRYQFSSGCGEQFQHTQTNWAVGTLREWIQVEKQRTRAFEVLALEDKIELSLGELELTFKIDRIDKMVGSDVSNGLVVMDYKTGDASLAGWHGERLSSPQLPLYLFAVQEKIATPATVKTLAYARVKRGDCKFIGATQDAESTDQFKLVEEHRSLNKEFDDWSDMRAHWHTVLMKLSAEFVAGEARVDPLPHVCRHCDLHTFCRISEPLQESDETHIEANEFGRQ